ncbi:hypothetical protein BASA60_003895 [Batrachochytrium salamandrivorans]|nr:hypothetical protein BASA60_003895 [Batrachochytrium salamandrivorans]
MVRLPTHFPTIKGLRENIEKITDEELQLGITDAFIMARDRHTRWTNIAPYGCFHATTGVTFTFIEGDPDITKKPTVVVTSTSTSSDLLALFGEDYSIFKLEMNCLQSMDCPFLTGSRRTSSHLVVVPMPLVDSALLLNILLRYMGKSTVCQVTTLSISSSNPGLTLRSYILSMSRMFLDTMRTVGILEANCTRACPVLLFLEHLKRTPPVSAEQPGHSHGSDTAHPSPGGHQTDSPEDPEREADMDQISSSRQKPAVSMNPTDVTEVTWGIYQPESTNMGIIRLDSFDPEDVGTNSLAIEKAIMIVRSLLVNELKDTKSVIYDLRGNPGGSADFADSMVQLFKPRF